MEGGYTVAPVIMDEFSKKYKLLKEDEMLDMIALAQSAPGALAVSLILLVRYKVKGIKGAFVSVLAEVLPSLMVISIIYYFYAEFANNNWVRAAMRGMAGVIRAVLVITTIRLKKTAEGDTPIFVLIVMVAAFILSYILKINTSFIILGLAVLGSILFSIKGLKLK